MSAADRTPAAGHTPTAAELTGRRALITGASRGMGRAHALALAARGADLALADIDAAELAETAEAVRAAGGTAVALGADITDREQAEKLVAEAVAALGGLDILVHNAGLIHSMTGLADTADEDVARLLAVNIWAPLHLTRAALPELRRSPAARVIFINSQWGQVPDGHSYGYMVSKAGQLGLMKTLAQEFAAERIMVNAVAPGAIATRMVPPENHDAEVAAVPVGRLGQPSEIADVVAFLAGDTGAFITGQTVPVNGGALLVGI
ncbi:SDR family NAD(P)-dependent oxidoreductase [Streptomyces sp. LHD-70]|uniref:SDR family NAD(P)-dependent oxidoreductase n=1 Tax=Streptomyces sp. LHD-70 TaxID=3072140 RepID=UPI00280F6964|nr:SDR family NAD(P)-dependent oxidoreductase [Streptomyces sp. LHD-70]MDQ8702590.1 SDR family NAD(P)-dependent oxidoreductase [Streptomyces sp. LHD-70]